MKQSRSDNKLDKRAAALRDNLKKRKETAKAKARPPQKDDKKS